MDFFSKLGKKASETYQITKEKATTLTEELKIKGQINDCKDKIEDLYKEIGKKVYEEIKVNNDVAQEVIFEKVEEIKKLEEKIEKAQAEILSLKKLKKCINCGAEIDEKDGFCSNCGKRQIIKQEEKVEIHEENTVEAKEAEVIEVNNVENEELKKEEQ